MWQKYELFSTFFHYFPKFSTIFSTAQLCFFRSIKAFCRHVGSGKPPPPRPLALPHMYSITSSLPSSIICRPSLRPSLRRPLRPSLVHPPIIDHLSSITYPPSLRHHIIDYFSSITCTPSLRRPLVVPHFVPPLSTLPSSIICRPSLRRPLIVHHFVPPLSTLPSSIICRPSLHRSFAVHHFIYHFSSIICHLSSFPAWTNRIFAMYRS